MIIWGGAYGAGYLNIGNLYDPITNDWTPLTTANAPAARAAHTAVWTGNEMIVWGGYIETDPNVTNTGGKYNPSANNWTATSTTNAPTARDHHTAVWTGSKMIVWGGNGNTGGRYDPSADTWTPTSLVNVPMASVGHTAVWTGSKMIVWGGYVIGLDVTNTGGIYDPNTDTWTPISTVGAPAARSAHTAVWTGSEMIIWGGQTSNGVFFNDGAKYNPSTNAWTPISNTNAPAARAYHTAIWTGGEMIVWGGKAGFPNPRLNTGGRYSPYSDDWLSTATANVPAAREGHPAVWTGNEMIVWGGLDSAGVLNDGGRYCARPTPQSAASRKTHGAAGTFDVDLPLSGTPGIECRTGGSTNDYILIVTFPRAVVVNGNPQAEITAGVGAVGSDGKPNGGMVFVGGNTVTIPLTNIANAQTINITLFEVNDVGNIILPMSLRAGDVNGNGAVNASDVSLTKSRIGQQVNDANFRADVNGSGAVNATDVAIVKSHIGTGLP